MIRLLSINILLLVSLNIFGTEAQHYSDYRVDITYYNESIDQIYSLLDDLDNIEIFFRSSIDFQLYDPFSFTIMPSVWDLTSSFNISSRVGAIYIDKHAYFQPLINLKSKNRYIKTLFTEYAHYYIDVVTDNNCPLWLNEALSYYYWLLYSGENRIVTNNILEIDELKQFSKMMNDPDKMNDFYNSIMIYFDYIFINGYTVNNILILLRENKVDESIKILKNG